MFDILTSRLSAAFKTLRGQGRLTEENIKDTLREVRTALLEADVAFSEVKRFCDSVRERAIGQEVMQSLNPGQAFIKIVNDELIYALGAAHSELNLNTPSPAIILMAGLQGAGKTTTTAKLAYWLKEIKKKSVMVCSVDVYRPAAMDQLKTLAQEIAVSFYEATPQQSPLAIAQAAIQSAKNQLVDIVIIDTAGRLHIDEAMMQEIKQLHQALNPIETLFVVDSMTGQDAANTAHAFDNALPLTGVILTKMDGDARGGAALSVRAITGKPIKFITTSENIEKGLEAFYPDRIASRILGMGDVLSLVEQAQQQLDHRKAENLAKKFKKGKGFDLNDFLDQLRQMKKMGGMASLLDKLPANLGAAPGMIKGQFDDKQVGRLEAIICSMTPQERRFPDVIRSSRKLRIAKGSGTQVQDVNRLLKQFDQMQKMMKRFSKSGQLQKMLRGLSGGFPGGFPQG